MKRYPDEDRAEAVALVARIGFKPAARQLGIPQSTLHRWARPEYAERCREMSLAAKARRRRPCVRGCGATCSYDNEGGICTRCQSAERAVWTRESIIEAIRAYAAQYGRPPGAMEWNPAQARAKFRDDIAERFYEDGGWPQVKRVQDLFGSWNAAIAAAGFTPIVAGHKYVDLEAAS